MIKRLSWFVLLVAVALQYPTASLAQMQSNGSLWQESYSIFGLQPPTFRVITDSTVWTLWSIESVGDTNHSHDWIEGEFTTANPGRGCLVLHNGFHCNLTDALKSKICRGCLRKEQWREIWYQRREDLPKTEYQVLDDSLRQRAESKKKDNGN